MKNDFIFSKAMRTINSIISIQKLVIDIDCQDISQLSTLLELLKTDVSNNRIVIIAVQYMSGFLCKIV